MNAIVLAAGASRRFGENKLTKLYKGQTVLGHLLEKLEHLAFQEVYVVTSEATQKVIGDMNAFKVLINKEAHKGMSTSIKLGLKESSTCDAYCFIVADQLALKKETLEAMLEVYETNEMGILCAAYQGELGNPVIFSSKYKDELMALQGDVGGKKVLKKHLDDVTLFEVNQESELIDIDTEKDWNRLLMEEESWNN